MMRALTLSTLTLLTLVTLSTPPALPCPFCSAQGQDATMRSESKQATLVLYGRIEKTDFARETTEFVIEKVLKPHPALGKTRSITLNRVFSVSEEKRKASRILVFCDVFKGKLDPYRGIAVEEKNNVDKYVTGVLKVSDKPMADRLAFYFKYLDHPEPIVSTDAFNEFAFADYGDYKDMAAKLPGDRIYGWLKEGPQPYRYGLYASMLGHCSTNPKRDATLLRSLVENNQNVTSGLDGILAAVVMIQPKKGWEYLQGILNDPDKKFTRRYSALRAVRFLYDYRPDVISKKELLAAVGKLIQQGDIADLAIEDLRKRKAWDRTDEVLVLMEKKTHQLSVVRRSIIRFALSSPKASAKKFIAVQRKKDSELVEDVEELLKLEQDTSDQ